jgi:hypothetical protein
VIGVGFVDRRRHRVEPWAQALQLGIQSREVFIGRLDIARRRPSKCAFRQGTESGNDSHASASDPRTRMDGGLFLVLHANAWPIRRDRPARTASRGQALAAGGRPKTEEAPEFGNRGFSRFKFTGIGIGGLMHANEAHVSLKSLPPISE